MNSIWIEQVKPTVCFRQGPDGLEQLVQVHLANDGPKMTVLMAADDHHHEVACPGGDGVCEIYLPAVEKPTEVHVEIRSAERVLGYARAERHPPREWVVHVVQLSHHSAGYTDLASLVLLEHDDWLDKLLAFAEATADYPEEARFRAVIEQGWSLLHYLAHAPPARAEAMLRLLQRGDLEVGALFGNMSTELCDDETLIRALYPVARLARRHGLAIRTAEHNGIPGFTWGLADALLDAGVELLCQGLPLYHQGDHHPEGYWDAAAIFGNKDLPGAFWWRAASGRRLLVWSNNQRYNNPGDPHLTGMADSLLDYEQRGYHGQVIRWPVVGAARDNSPYLAEYADTIRAWNERWIWPRLVSSTNSRFLDDFRKTLPADLPVFHGGLPGQDYPPGSMATARATTAARQTQAELPEAQRLASLAALRAGHQPDPRRFDLAWEELLWHCEHSWGHYFPAGPAARTSELEKAVHAHRAQALAEELARKASVQVADHVHLSREGLHLVVFNPSPWPRTDRVRHPLRELDSCGGELVNQVAGEKAGGGALRSLIQKSRWPIHPDPEMVAGNFRLIDSESGATIPFQLLPIPDVMAEVPDAAQRLGLSRGHRRHGIFDEPGGLARDLCFVARDVPAGGWRTYRLEPGYAAPTSSYYRQTTLESPHYRVTVQPETGFIRSIIDKGVERELVASYGEHPFGSLLVMDPAGGFHVSALTAIHPLEMGPVCSRLRLEYAALGHPRIGMTVLLWNDLKLIELAISAEKASNPLLSVHLAFPFAIAGGRFTIDDTLAVVDPAHDRLPGAYLNRLTCRDWVCLADSTSTLFWSSLDSPVMSLGQLWPTRVSPTHASIPEMSPRLAPQQPQDLAGGAIYSTLFKNNFGTNFPVSQESSCLFRYVITSYATPDASSLAVNNRFGAMARRPLSAIYTEHAGERHLPASGGWMRFEDERLQLVAFKAADDGDGYILRCRNNTWDSLTSRITFAGTPLLAATLVSNTEAAINQPPLVVDGESLQLRLAPRSCQTVRLHFEAGIGG